MVGKYSTFQGTSIIPLWEKENHLQNAIFGGYVNSLEGRPWRALFQIQGLWKRCLVEECQADPSARHVPWQREVRRSHLTLQKNYLEPFFDSQLNRDFQPFPIYTVYIKIWFIIQLKQPFIKWLVWGSRYSCNQCISVLSFRPSNSLTPTLECYPV